MKVGELWIRRLRQWSACWLALELQNRLDLIAHGKSLIKRLNCD